ncbi:putative glycolipid-binding domain-containing protein [Dietzia sp. ANT_WB102]|uniref:putative glycolipid-binding domain-containing protein n=1 Tax=Dietzia sp. ANT_WB102 TaxID=2597345 RepID=UPI00210479C3|nr:putative glycolipid-binding domain-containing protein [Dietzia sp. ANT_WB102]
MNASQSPSPKSEVQSASAPRLYTWISETGRLIEQVRVVTKGDSSRARGRIVAATDPEHPAFTVEYEAQLGSDTALRRVGLTVTTEEIERTIDLVCDGEGDWLLEDSSGTRSRVGADGVVDVDITYSVFFASVMIRRLGLHAQPGSAEERVLSVDSLTLDVTEDTVTLSSDDEQVHGITATASTSATVDSDGIIVDVPGLSRRV